MEKAGGNNTLVVGEDQTLLHPQSGQTGQYIINITHKTPSTHNTK